MNLLIIDETPRVPKIVGRCDGHFIVLTAGFADVSSLQPAPMSADARHLAPNGDSFTISLCPDTWSANTHLRLEAWLAKHLLSGSRLTVKQAAEDPAAVRWHLPPANRQTMY